VAKKSAFLLSSSVAVCAFVAATSLLPNVDASVMPDPEHRSMRDLLLRALGTAPLEAGNIRIPITADGPIYEVIVKRPSAPRLIPVERSNGD
jgi:hypothetical protein